MSAKTLARSGVSLFSRLSNPLLHRTVNPNYFLCSYNSEETFPMLFPSFSKFPTSLHLPKIDAETVNRVAFEGFSHPCGLPSLRFFLPEGNFCPSSEPMLLFPKRTFQPSVIRRKRNHGFFARKATKGGRRVISRRIAKGRYRITA